MQHRKCWLAFIVWITFRSACQQPSELPSAPEPSAVQRFEVGAIYSNLGLNSCERSANCPPLPPHQSFGPSVTLNLDRHWAIDASYDVTTGYQPLRVGYYFNGSVAGGRGSKAMIDGRFNLRSSKYALFAYGKAGAAMWSGIESDTFAYPHTRTYAPHAYFAVGAGAGAEYSLTPRARVRASVGDLVVDYRRDFYRGCPACFASYGGTAWDHNSDLNIGIYVGLGKAIEQAAPVSIRERPHRFFDKTNLALLGVDVLAQTADGIQTQHFIQHGYVEGDGLARPLVNQGWPGQVAGIAIVTGGEALVMYGLHRMGHHRVERWFPLAAVGPSAYLAYSGFKNWGYYESH